MDTDFGRFLLPGQIASAMSKHSKVYGSLVYTNAAVTFVESNIQDPMAFIFDRPMFSDHNENKFGITGQTGDVKTNGSGLFSIDDPDRNDHGEGFQTSLTLVPLHTFGRQA